MSQLPLFQPSTWTVAGITQYLRQLLEDDAALQDLWVVGEVSNCSRPSSGHLYFTLKDASASMRVVMWRGAVLRQEYIPREGDAVEVHGAISIYETSGLYQLYADAIRPTGEGYLYQEFLRLKARLEAEGLFDEERKRPVPRWPHCIGIVTSPTGAALRDILNTLQRRFPLARVVLAPTAVQGEEAPAGIIAALQTLNAAIHPDVILLARGGGSIEDLWAFNDEYVARAIAASPVPVICGVGHETDFTIADFAADLRAPTPTAAAELAVPDSMELRAGLEEQKDRLKLGIRSVLDTPIWRMQGLQNRLRLNSPLTRLRSGRQHLDELCRRQQSGLLHLLQLKRLRLEGASLRLETLNPQAILGRGYAIVRQADGRVVRSVHQVQPGEGVRVQVGDGEFGARVEDQQARSKP